MLDLRSIRSFLARSLVRYAFVEEWERDWRTFEQATPHLGGRIPIEGPLADAVADADAIVAVGEQMGIVPSR